MMSKTSASFVERIETGGDRALSAVRQLIDDGELAAGQASLHKYLSSLMRQKASPAREIARLRARRLEAKVQELRGDVSTAIKTVREEGAKCRSLDPVASLNFLRHEAYLHWIRFDLGEVRRVISELELGAKTCREPVFLTDVYVLLGLLAEMQWNNQLAEAHYVRADNLALEYGYPRRRIMATLYRGRALLYQGRIGEAYTNSCRALALARDAKRLWQSARVKQADILFHMERYDEAEAVYDEVRAWSEARGLELMRLRLAYKVDKVKLRSGKSSFSDFERTTTALMNKGLRRHGLHFLLRGARDSQEADRALAIAGVHRVIAQLQGLEKDAAVIVADALNTLVHLDPQLHGAKSIVDHLKTFETAFQPSMYARLRREDPWRHLVEAMRAAKAGRTIPLRDGRILDIETGRPAESKQGERSLGRARAIIEYLNERRGEWCTSEAIGQHIGTRRDGSFRQAMMRVRDILPEGELEEQGAGRTLRKYRLRALLARSES